MADVAATSNETPLRVLAQRRGFHVGAAVNDKALKDDPLYSEVLAREFNMVTCENAMKFGPLRPARDQFAFEAADAIVAFAEAHQMAVRGHALVWHTMVPAWFTDARFGYDDAVDVLRDHIYTVTRRYRGKLAAWDVVNEGIDDDGAWRKTIFLKTFGPDYLAMAFHWAHEGDPDAKLFYNDYEADAINRKSNAVYTLLSDLRSQGVPVHGVGLQMHLDLSSPPDPRSIADNIRRFNALGLEVHITEMDVKTESSATERTLDEQARVYRDILDVCLAAPCCPTLITWGVTDRYSWIPQHFPGLGSALLFDQDARPKPAYFALRDALRA